MTKYVPWGKGATTRGFQGMKRLRRRVEKKSAEKGKEKQIAMCEPAKHVTHTHRYTYKTSFLQ